MFEDYLKEGLVRKVTPDKQLAKSLVKVAILRIKNLESTSITEDNSFSFIENCYEAIREMTDALMALKGFKSYSHEASIEFLKKFYSIQLTMSNVYKIDRYRKIRNDIKYRGLLTSKNEAENVFKNTKIILKLLLEILKKEGLEV
jgi:hypothetical protein